MIHQSFNFIRNSIKELFPDALVTVYEGEQWEIAVQMNGLIYRTYNYDLKAASSEMYKLLLSIKHKTEVKEDSAFDWRFM